MTYDHLTDQEAMDLARSIVGGCVYFVGTREHGMVKIGVTHMLADRFGEIQACSPVKLEVLSYRLGDRMMEANYHRKFAAYREHGEWFRLEGELAEYIEARRKFEAEYARHVLEKQGPITPTAIPEGATLLPVAAAAEIAGVSKRTLERRIQRGEVDVFRLGGVVRVVSPRVGLL